MRARDVMSVPVVTVNTETTIGAAARTLRERGLRSAPVVDGDGKLVGVVSELDLFRAGPPGSGLLVGEVMTSPARSMTPGAHSSDLADMLTREAAPCIPIVEGTVVVGMVTRYDLVRAQTSTPAPGTPGTFEADDDCAVRTPRPVLPAQAGPDLTDGVC
jgi:CBS domain-containing protein